ncbi:MAG: phenylacetic acid degradation protein PaaD [Hyphomicrobiales bacterium]|nr:MAG: phenylacetic acid degradation protein PaaD [Hyphomicrobiales bacterium]
MDAQQLAQACADAMWEDDKAARSLGIEIVEVSPGHAVARLTITDSMVNGHDICHGGYIFLLADSAFAYACNTYDQRTVAQHCTINFLAPAHSGDVLTANAVERQRAGRSGIYDISVTNANGVAIVEFRGMSRTIKGTLIEAEGSGI